VQTETLTTVTEFLDLLQQNEKNLIKIIKENPKAFSKDYWRILINIKTPARPYGVMQNSQKVIMDLIN
jgi:hypothetical protein